MPDHRPLSAEAVKLKSWIYVFVPVFVLTLVVALSEILVGPPTALSVIFRSTPSCVLIIPLMVGWTTCGPMLNMFPPTIGGKRSITRS